MILMLNMLSNNVDNRGKFICCLCTYIYYDDDEYEQKATVMRILDFMVDMNHTHR